MDLTRSRLRYLAALGLVGGCTSSPVASSTTPPTATAALPSASSASSAPTTATATATGSAVDAAPPPPVRTVRRDPLEGGAWAVVEEVEVRDRPTPDPGRRRSPSCPSGTFCLASAPEKPGESAPAPYETCAATAVLPLDTSSNPQRKQPQRWVRFANELTKSERASDPSRAGACCYAWVIPCPGGRTLRADNDAVVAPTFARDGWLEGAIRRETSRNASPFLGMSPDDVLAAAWAGEAAFEHASVASFNLAIVDWMRLGAPAELVEAGQRAALDEIAHARALYAIASRHAGAPLGPGPLPVRVASAEASFDRVTRETFLDACVNECVAAALADARAERAEDPEVRAALHTIARDEAAHAELAWRVVGWLLDAGGEEARAALAIAIEALEAMPSPPACPDAPERGFLSVDAQIALRERVIDEVVRPIAAALLGRGPAATA
jgi:hypothetical protein